MKYLFYFLGLILLLIIIFFGSGLLRPSVSYESEVTVDKSIKEAWAIMSDESKLPEWIKGFKRTELISGDAGKPGAISNIYVEDAGQEMVMKETIIDIKPNERMAMTFTMDFMDMDYEMLLSEKDGKTTLKSKSTTKGNGMFAKSMVSFMKGAMKKQEDENMNNLKKVINENKKDYFPVMNPDILEELEQ